MGLALFGALVGGQGGRPEPDAQPGRGMGQARDSLQRHRSRPGTDGRRLFATDAGEVAGRFGQKAESSWTLWHARGAGRPGGVPGERRVRLYQWRADRDGWRRAAQRLERIRPSGRAFDRRTVADDEAEEKGNRKGRLNDKLVLS